MITNKSVKIYLIFIYFLTFIFQLYLIIILEESEMSLVSVIMPYYKKKLYIEDSIKSILNQTYQKFEIILVNDEKMRLGSI